MTLKEMMGGREPGWYEVQRPGVDGQCVTVHRTDLTDTERALQFEVLQLLIESRQQAVSKIETLLTPIKKEMDELRAELILLASTPNPSEGVQ